jgi:hypothetical protein
VTCALPTFMHNAKARRPTADLDVAPASIKVAVVQWERALSGFQQRSG